MKFLSVLFALAATFALAGQVSAHDSTDATAHNTEAHNGYNTANTKYSTASSSYTAASNSYDQTYADYQNKKARMPMQAQQAVDGYLANARTKLADARINRDTAYDYLVNGTTPLTWSDTYLQSGNWDMAYDEAGSAISDYFAPSDDYSDTSKWDSDAANDNINSAKNILASF